MRRTADEALLTLARSRDVRTPRAESVGVLTVGVGSPLSAAALLTLGLAGRARSGRGRPSSRPARNVRAQDGWRPLRQDETLQCMSVPFQLIQYEQAVAASEERPLRDRQPTTHAFTLRTEGKKQLRRELFQMFGLSQSALFPDFAGFAQFGRSFTALVEAGSVPLVTESPRAPT